MILLSGVAAILVMMGLLFVQLTRSWGRILSASASAAQDELAAASGMEYAAARLLQSSAPPAARAASNRGDDWAFRDDPSTPLASSLNPSYAHGEQWLDADPPDGAYDGSETRGADLDGDGRLSPWSGRVRGGGSLRGLPFSLRVDSPEGKIPLNAGLFHDGVDNDADGLVDEPDEPSKSRDLSIPYHRGLAHALNNLGAILLPVTGTRRWDIPSGADVNGDGTGDGDPVRASLLGNDLILDRPDRGYRSPEEVEQTLRALGYSPKEVEAILPFLDTGPYGLPCDSARDGNYVPISLWAAPREVLEALWRYLSVPSPTRFTNDLFRSPRTKIELQEDFPGETQAFPKVCPRSGLRYVNTSTVMGKYQFPRLLLFPSEARRLADAAIELRKQGSLGWRAFRAELQRRAPAIFAEDWGALGSGTPLFQRSWVSAKGELAFQAVCEDPTPRTGLAPGFGSLFIWRYPGWGFCSSSTLATWGVDRDGDPANGISPPPQVDFLSIRTVPYPSPYLPGSPTPWSYNDPAYPYFEDGYQGGQMGYAGPVVRPQGLSLSAPCRFRVESRAQGGGGGTSLEGTLRVAERLSFTSQDDFECGLPAGHLPGTGVALLDRPSAAVRRDAPLGCSPATVTLPLWNWRGVTPGPQAGFSRSHGAVGLGTTETDLGSALLHFPLREDFDGIPSDRDSIPPWNEFWSEHDGNPDPPWDPVSPPPYRFPGRGPPYAPAAGGGGLSWWAANRKPTTVYAFRNGNTTTQIGVNNVIEKMSIEARFGVGSFVSFWPGNGGPLPVFRLYTRRGYRPGGDGTEFILECCWNAGYLTPLGQSFYWEGQTIRPYRDAGTIYRRVVEFVPDSGTGGAWSYHACLALEKFYVGQVGRDRDVEKTRCRLTVNGDDLWVITLDAMPYYGSPYGAMYQAVKCQAYCGHLDNLRLYESVASPDPAPRYVEGGTFLSPLVSLDAPARLGPCQWTGAVPADGSLAVEVTGYRDALGTDPVGSVPLGTDADLADLSTGMAEPVRSFRYAVRMTRPNGVDETPIFESIWITMRRKGYAPAWTAWKSR